MALSMRCTLQGSANTMWSVIKDLDRTSLEATAIAHAPDAPFGFNCCVSGSLEC